VRPSLDPFTLADVASGLLWSVAYLLILRRGFLDRAPGTPLAALAPAITWEILYGIVHPTPDLPAFVVPMWLAIDAAIVYQYLRYGLAEQRRARPISAARFHARFALAMALALGIEHAVIRAIGDRDGVWSGFAVNVIMSLAFLDMLARRRDVRGQSVYIALAKLAGTAVTIPHALALHGDLGSLRAFMAASVVADVAYVVLMARQCRAQGIRPWARV
jgi:hypothetical protein